MFIKWFIFILFILLSCTYLSLLERLIVGIIQRRVGPNLTGGSFGLLQPFSDAFKLITKQLVFPSKANWKLFSLGPIFLFVWSFSLWNFSIIYSTNAIYLDSCTEYNNYKYTPLFILLTLNLSNIPMLFSILFSNNKVKLLGVFRSLSLTFSYGLTISLILLSILIPFNTWDFSNLIHIKNKSKISFLIVFLLGAFLYSIITISEIKKIPFDVSESESELGSGFLIEFSGFHFALCVISEYSFLLFFLLFFNILFIKHYCIFLIFLIYVYFTIRSVLPNFKFNYIMLIHWKYIFPITLVYLYFLLTLFN